MIEFKYSRKLEEKDISSFLSDYGFAIKNILIDYAPTMIFILKQVPNLVELTCDMNQRIINEPNIDNTFKLPKLKVLNLRGVIRSFIRNAKDVNNLRSLKVTHYDVHDNELLTNFVAQQKNLKEFSILDRENHKFYKRFPTRDISHELKFKLTKLHIIYHCGNYNDNLLKFLAFHLENLTDLNLRGSFNIEILENIFKNGKKLERLILDSIESYWSYRYKNWMLPSVKYFSSNNLTLTKYKQILKAFPNVVSLCFLTLRDEALTFPQLESLYVVHLECRELLKLKIHNLRKLTVFQISKNNVEEFSKNVPNLESFTIDGHLPDDLKFLKYFKKLQKFEVISMETKQLQILVSYSEKTVYHYKIESEKLEILYENFPDFIFVEKRLDYISGFQTVGYDTIVCHESFTSVPRYFYKLRNFRGF